MTRKLISLFLCAAFAAGSLSLLASCADSGNDGDDGGEVAESPSVKVPIELTFKDLPEEERTINIAYVEGGNMTLTEHSLVVDDDNIDKTDNVDIAVQTRNQHVQSQLGVKLNAIKVSEDFGALAEEVKDEISIGSGAYDLLAAYQYYSIGMAVSDGTSLVLNLNNLSAVGPDAVNADYIDMYASYWGGAYNDALSYKQAYYWLTGDIALRYLGGMYCTFVNSKTYAERLEADYGNIYAIAKSGNWTLDMMMEMSAKCYHDVNADDTPNEGDKFGFGFEMQDPIDGIVFASGVQFSYRDPNTGDISLTFNNQHAVDTSTKMRALLKDAASFEFAATDSETVMTNFAAGNVAFTINKIFMSQVYLTEFNDFYLIPAPKYDTNQANYITGIHDGVTLFGIPIDCYKLPQTAATLELMAAYSEQYVKPAYYDAALKNRYVRDPQAAEMIDLIHSNVNTDFVAAWSNSLDNIVHAYRGYTPIDSAYFGRRYDNWIKLLSDLTTGLETAAVN